MGKPILDDEGKEQYEKVDKVKTYTLTFFYTERGASGSTCWMQFTLPTVVGLDLDKVLDEQVNEDTGSLSIEKELSGVENTEWFEFELKLKDPNGRDDNFELDYLLRDANGNLIPNDVLNPGEGVEVDEHYKDYIADGSLFHIRAGDVLVIRNLPLGTTYTVTELTTAGYHTQVTIDDGQPEQSDTAKGEIELNKRYKVVFTNASSYELPATGGSGTTLWYAMGTLLIFEAAYLMYKWKKRRGDAMC